MQIILISGLSGSGKSVALNVLEDASYHVVDKLPATLLPQRDAGYCREMAMEELAALLAEVPLYREANARFLGLTPVALTDWLVGELTRAKVIRREGDRLLAV